VWGDIIGACDNRSIDTTVPIDIVLQWVNSIGQKVRSNCSGAKHIPFRVGTTPKYFGSCRHKRRR
ncbi:hypothetical protein TI05_12015, partial [Achromatium sp. WMS3]